MRLLGWNPDDTGEVRLRIMNPGDEWGRAGLHTGDRLVAMNGKSISNWPELRTFLVTLRIGDSVRVDVTRPVGPFSTTVRVTGYDRSQVSITPSPRASAKQASIRERWMTGW